MLPFHKENGRPREILLNLFNICSLHHILGLFPSNFGTMWHTTYKKKFFQNTGKINFYFCHFAVTETKLIFYASIFFPQNFARILAKSSLFRLIVKQEVSMHNLSLHLQSQFCNLMEHFRHRNFATFYRNVAPQLQFRNSAITCFFVIRNYKFAT